MIQRTTVLLCLLVLGVVLSQTACGISIKPLQVCASKDDCTLGRLCIRNVCVSNATSEASDGGKEAPQSEPSGESVGAQESNPNQEPTPNQEGVVERPQDSSGDEKLVLPQDEQGGTGPVGSEPRPGGEDSDGEGQIVINDGGDEKEDGPEFIDPNRERLFIPDLREPDFVPPPIPDMDNDPERAPSVDAPADGGGKPDHHNGREPGVRPETVPEQAPVDRAPFPDEDQDNTKCNPGETLKCYPPGAQGCDVSSGQCKGICELGKRTCTNGTWSACTGARVNQPIKCNGKDNNCDGHIDGHDGRCPP
ncbi:MAG: hypothetical protein EP343_22860 [Deltaproteobacteria bacterium]|nr:MAG: hypothetical protein EP343_22860 [Deltaproteobacteria bacterium]